MKLATFSDSKGQRIGVVNGNSIVDLSEHAPSLPTDMIAFLEAGEKALGAARTAANAPGIPLDRVKLEAPVQRPRKVLGIGLNYADHIAESGMAKPERQVWFTKQHNGIVGPSDPFLLPAVSQLLDYEAELCFVIGKRCKHVPRERASEVIAGFCVGNDVSVRDWQFHSQTMLMGKSFDTHAPLGPWLVTPDEIGDPHGLDIKCWVNGELRQSSNTRQLIFNCYDQIAYLSQAFRLEPGDVIYTGTPAGVGAAMKPPSFLKVGDRVRIEIERIGSIENWVEPEPDVDRRF